MALPDHFFLWKKDKTGANILFLIFDDVEKFKIFYKKSKPLIKEGQYFWTRENLVVA